MKTIRELKVGPGKIEAKPVAMTKVGPGELKLNVTVTTLEEIRQEEARAREEYRQRDIVDRLKARTKGPSFDEHYHGDLHAAIDEIEWLRASKPNNIVTRSELDAMTAKLRDMQSTIAAMLDSLERKQRVGEEPKREGKRR